MERAAIISGNTVENVVVAGPTSPPDRLSVLVPKGVPVQAGWLYEKGVFSPPIIPLEVKKQLASDRVNAKRDAMLFGGFAVPPEASSNLSGMVLQTRDADDKVNWKLSLDAYRDAAGAGYGETPQATFRTADNLTVTVSINEGIAVLVAMQAWGVAVLGRSWALKDAIAAATDDAALDAIDVTAGWPD